jgi:dihydropteroate synthase
VILRLRDRTLPLGKPLLMGIVNATPDSFSEPEGARSHDDLVQRAREQLAAGAALVDVGGESGRTDTEAVPAEEEIARVIPVVQRLVAEGVTVSVDTWRAPVARAALDVGAAMINDPSCLSDPELADACAATGAGLVVTHTRILPKTKGFPDYADVVEDVVELLRERTRDAERRGVSPDQIVLDPGIDLAKTPAESVDVLRRLARLHVLGRPLLVAASRKDFIGAITHRSPADRLPGTLAALGVAADGGAAILRVHDVAEADDFLAVRAALDGEPLVGGTGGLHESLRREPV